MTDHELTEFAKELFRIFARFEYALKEAGFHTGEGDASPHWRNFALSIDELLDEQATPELTAAIGYILDQPPRKQVVRNGELAWELAPPQTDSRADLLLLYVRRVRNNLFHGGKFNGHWFEPDRSETLMKSALVILNAALAASDPVRQAYG